MPFILFERQAQFVSLLHSAVREQAPVLCAKSRDMGVTWLGCAFSVWLWIFWRGASVGWGSRKADLVDKIGDPDSIFEKIRILLQWVPPEFLPRGFREAIHMSFMKIVNPETGATITGESGDDIGRGGRKLVYFKDEAAHYEHPESIESAISNNTNVPVDVSSVNGPATVFQRKMDAGWVWQPGQPLRRDAVNVFIFDWSEHPEKTREWHDTLKKKMSDEGLYHLFAQEVERNASASVVGTLIELEWFEAAIGAAQKLGVEVTGGWGFALDVADGDSQNADRNALAGGQGIELSYLDEWGERDVGTTTRRTVDVVAELAGGPATVEYDCIGVGAGVKAEVNRLQDEGLLRPRRIRFCPWNAGGKVLEPERRVIPHDRNSILNKDFYANLKAQGWWQLRLRFERTWRAVTDPSFTYDRDEIISIDPRLPLLRKLQKELLQVTQSKNTTLKLVINKTPEGQASPNLADAVMMRYWPSDHRSPMVVSADAVRATAAGRGPRPSLGVFNPQQLAQRGQGYTGGGIYSSRQASFNDY